MKKLDVMTGGIRYSTAKVDLELEKKKYPAHFNKELLEDIENREQKLIRYWEDVHE